MTMTNAAEKLAHSTIKIDFKNLDETDLVAALLRREDAAWREMIRRYDQVLRHEARKSVKGAVRQVLASDWLDDVIADLHLELLENDMRKIRIWADGPKVARFGSWLGMLVRQAAIDHARRAARDLRLKDAPTFAPRDTDPNRGGAWLRMEIAATEDAPKKRRNRREREEV